jgi:Fe-S cluster assembly protein SufD
MSSLPITDTTADQIAERARAAGEPEWLVERRREAWAHFVESPLPEWRRTDISALDLAKLAPAEAPQGTAIQWDETLAAQGVICTNLTSAVRSHADLVQKYLDVAVPFQAHKFTALRAALWQDGVFLYVPKNVALDVPLRVIYTLAESTQAAFPRTLVVLEQGASVTLIEEYTSNDRADITLAGPSSEIFAGPGSSIRFISAQHWGSKVYHFGAQRIVLERDANAEWTSIALGGQVQHIDAETTLLGNGSRVNWLGATFANDNQILYNGPWLRHAGNNAESFMQFKTVVNDHGYSVFDGMIKIELDTKATATRLEEHALHLSPESRNDSIPGLKIDSNDVLRGGHASTSGDVDDMQLFYMQARGINRDEARRMIVMGFLAPALDTIPVDDLREALTSIIEGKI